MLDHGLLGMDYKRITDAEGNPMTWDWLFKAVKGMPESAIRKFKEDAISYGLAKRTIELVEKKLPIRQIFEDLKNNKLPPDSMLEKYPDIMDKVVMEKYGEAVTVKERVAELKEKEKKSERESRYDFSDADITGAGGQMFSDYEISKNALANFEKMKTEEKERFKIIQDLDTRYKMFAGEILKILADSGRISMETFNTIKETNSEYISFNRLEQAKVGEDLSVFKASKGRVGVATEVVHKIKGSAKTIIDPYESLAEGLYKGVREAHRNYAMKTFRDMLLADREMGVGEQLKLADIGRLAKEGDPNTIKIYIDGVPEYWQFEKDIYESMKGMDEFSSYAPFVLTWYAKTLRFFVTTAPQFAIRNRIRDCLNRLIVGKGKVSYKDFVDRKKFKEMYEVAGGGQFGYHLGNKKAYAKLQEQTIKKLSGDKNFTVLSLKAIKDLGGMYGRMLKSSEMATRIEETSSVYRKLIKEGKSELDATIGAVFAGRDLLDFAVMGNKIRIINQIFPFTNAKIQGFRKLMKSAGDNPKLFAVKFSLYALLPVILNSLLIDNEDEEVQKEYKKMPNYQRDMFFNIPRQGGGFYTIPKPFEVGVLASFFGRLLDKFILKDEKPYDGEYFRFFVEQFFPGNPSMITGSSNVLYELISNYDSFRQKGIVPDYEEGKLVDPSLRPGMKYASNFSQEIYKLSNKIGFAIDPRYIDHLIKGLFSYYGDMALRASNTGREDTEYKITPAITGLIKDEQAYSSKDVRWVLDAIKKYDLINFGKSRYDEDVTMFKYKVNKYLDEKDVGKKKDMAEELIDFSETLRKKMEEPKYFEQILKWKRQGY
jgi:hypothetical protein